MLGRGFLSSRVGKWCYYLIWKPVEDFRDKHVVVTETQNGL